MSNLNILGWEKFSLLDYPGKISTIIFTGGCNLRCGWCHNPQLVLKEDCLVTKQIPEKEIFVYLQKRHKKMIDAISICGGEPTIHGQDLLDFCETVKEKYGLLIKIDTNGTNPKIIKELINNNLVDYLAMDVKPILLKDEDYKESVKIVKKFIDKKDGEFRLTVVPTIVTTQNIENILSQFKDSKKMYLQNFSNEHQLIDKKLQKTTPYDILNIEEMKNKVSYMFKSIEIRS